MSFYRGGYLCSYKKKLRRTLLLRNALLKSFHIVILQGFEPWTHALEGRCSNPTELQNHPFVVGAKVIISLQMHKGCGAFLQFWRENKLRIKR